MQRLFEIINELTATASTLEKQAILTRHKDNEKLKLLFLWTYNPMVNYYIKKLPDNKTAGKGSLNDDNMFDEFGTLLVELNDRVITGHDAIEQTQEFLSHLNEVDQVLAIRVLFRDLRCNVTDTTANKVWKDLIPTFEVQLAKTYDPEKPTASHYYCSNKMDGLRSMFVYGSGLYTRQGKKIIGFDDLENELSQVCDQHNIGAIDGELFSRDMPFEEIQGAVMRNKNIDPKQKKQVKLFVFAVLKDFNRREIFKTTKEMVDVIDAIFKTKREYMVKVQSVLIKDSQVNEYHDKFAADGYEGIMLRSVDVSYDFKRSKHLLKFKKFLEEDFKMVDAFEGKGKYVGSLGGILVEGVIDGKKITSEVGSGFDDSQRAEFWKNRKKLIGSKVEIKFQGVTPDSSLRFPVFNKFKLDR